MTTTIGLPNGVAAAPSAGLIEEPAPDEGHPAALVEVTEIPIVRLGPPEPDVRVHGNSMLPPVNQANRCSKPDSFGPAMQPIQRDGPAGHDLAHVTVLLDR